jgi:hypothetical protein
MKKTSLIVSLVAVLTLSSMSFADILLSDNFASYANGNLISVNAPIPPATVLSTDQVGATSSGVNAWTVHSTTAGYGRVQANNGTLVLNQKTNKEDINASLSRTIAAGETLYAAFDVTVGDLSGGANVTPNGALYFAHFKDSGTFDFAPRVGITAPTAGGNFAFTMYSGSAFSAPVLGDALYNTQYRIVMSYNQDGTCKLWVNPVSESSASQTLATTYTNYAISAFAFREVGTATGSYATLTTQTLDNLAVGTSFAEVVPEPATMTLLAIGGLLFARRK